MQAWIVLTLISCTLAITFPKEEVLKMTYDEPTLDNGASMDVHINNRDETISYHMLEQGNLADVETIEDFNTGFAASRVDDEESCYIRKIGMTFEEAVKKAQELAASGPQEYLGTEEVLAIPAEDADEWAGDRITKFCGEYSVYKLVKTEEDVEAESERAEDLDALTKQEGNERITIVFRKCFIFFFFYKCITTTITVPTGTTIFFFFFG